MAFPRLECDYPGVGRRRDNDRDRTARTQRSNKAGRTGGFVFRDQARAHLS